MVETFNIGLPVKSLGNCLVFVCFVLFKVDHISRDGSLIIVDRDSGVRKLKVSYKHSYIHQNASIQH